ncbi:hypothetical protein [Tsuneonella sp. HG222]
MGGEVWQFVGSLAAVGILVALVRALGTRAAPVLDGEREARAVAQGLHGGFLAENVIIGRNDDGALLRDSRGRIVAVVAHGAHFVAREIAAGTPARAEGDALVLDWPGRTERIDLGSGEAADWAAAINRLS